MKNYCVYWYKRPTFTDPYTEGYIGITNNIIRRNLEHSRSKIKTHFTNALQKYSDIDYLILHSNISINEALSLEYEYRPTTNIGWNTAIGGEDTLGSIRRTPIQLYHKDSYVILHSFNSITEAAKTLNISIGRLVQAKHRGTISYGLDGWAILHDPNHDRSTTITVQTEISQRLTGMKRSKPSHFKGKLRWSDEDKKRISQQHKGKVISEKQKEQMRVKNRATNPSCKAVTLKHKDSDTVYSYHSISEASRQLNLPLSRLKSKARATLGNYGNDGWAILSLGSG